MMTLEQSVQNHSLCLRTSIVGDFDEKQLNDNTVYYYLCIGLVKLVSHISLNIVGTSLSSVLPSN